VVKPVLDEVAIPGDLERQPIRSDQLVDLARLIPGVMRSADVAASIRDARLP